MLIGTANEETLQEHCRCEMHLRALLLATPCERAGAVVVAADTGDEHAARRRRVRVGTITCRNYF